MIEKLGRKVTMFHPDGTPARATLSVSFKEYRTLRKQLEDTARRYYELAARYADEFHRDMDALGCVRPDGQLNDHLSLDQRGIHIKANQPPVTTVYIILLEGNVDHGFLGDFKKFKPHFFFVRGCSSH